MRKLNENGLTQAQECFLQEYLKTSNGYQSYIKAYPNAKKWKRNSVDCKASLLLDNEKIQQRISEHNAKVESTLLKSTTLNKRKILNEIIELQQNCKQSGNGQNPTQLQALRLLAQVAGLLTESPQVQVNIQNNTVVGEVSDYLNL